MKSVTQRFLPAAKNDPKKMVVIQAEQPLQPFFTTDNFHENLIVGVVKACLEAGFSDSRVIKEVLGYKGNSYQAGKQLLERIKHLLMGEKNA
ncbi:MAG: hypothetical protein QNJ63_06505 [Calothrix sp. MO_192.B10]|nr:hypothetical protein [Calothrix sp. MO_192.B10]